MTDKYSLHLACNCELIPDEESICMWQLVSYFSNLDRNRTAVLIFEFVAIFFCSYYSKQFDVDVCACA